MSEDKKPFTVSDRRHFTSEGEVRKSDADEPTPARATAEAGGAPSAPPPAAATAPGPGPLPEAAPAATATATAADAGLDDEPGSRFPSDFLGLLISLGAQGSMLLMGGPEGESPDLDGARSLIELLGALKEKTEGRRTAQEDQLIDGLLYELRMAFVQATKAAGR